MAAYDAILILGGGVRDGGGLPEWARRRYDLAADMQTGEPLVCLSAATAHKPPPLDAHGFPLFECAAGAQYLMSRGIPARQIRLEALSYDTVGNAYFSKLLHVDPAEWQKLLVITSEFHMPRSRVIFEWVYGLDSNRSYELDFTEASDAGLDPNIIGARREKEAAALDGFRQTAQRLTTAAALHEWIFTEHSAYTPGRAFLNSRVQDANTRESY